MPIRLRMLMPAVSVGRGDRAAEITVALSNGSVTGSTLAGSVRRFISHAPDPAVQALQSLGHSFPGQCAHVNRLGLLEKLRDIACRNRVLYQARFQPSKPESRQHQQPRDECNEQPRHKWQVNTAKVSAGSRISTLSRVIMGKPSRAAAPVSGAAAAAARRWSSETHLGLVRRARRMNRKLAQAFPTRLL